MAKGPRKQTAKFFLHHNRSSSNQGKVYMALVLSRTALWRMGKHQGEEELDRRVGDQSRIDRKGHTEWMQRNAFLYRGYLPSLDPACRRLEIPMEIQNFDMPSFHELMNLYGPIGEDQIRFFIDEKRSLSHQYAGMIPMAFRSNNPETLQFFRTACLQDEANGDVEDIWPDASVSTNTVIAKTSHLNLLSLRDHMTKHGYPVTLSVHPVPTFEELLLAHAVYMK